MKTSKVGVEAGRYSVLPWFVMASGLAVPDAGSQPALEL